MLKRGLAYIIFILSFISFANAAVLNVDINDGSCDNVTGTPFCNIQAAINNAGPGDMINVASGTYFEQITINKNLTLTGDPGNSSAGPGVNAPVLDGNDQVGGSPLQDGMINLDFGVSDVVIEGFEVRNYRNSASPTPGTCLPLITGGVGSGIVSWNEQTKNIKVQDNYFHDLGWNGILVGSDDNSLQSNWTIQGNIVSNVLYAGIELTNVNNSKVLNNTIIARSDNCVIDPGDSGVGIEIATRTQPGGIVNARNNLVDNNIVIGSLFERAGINILSRAYQSTSSSTLRDVTISNNSISNSIAKGIFITAESRNNGFATVRNINILGNRLNNNSDGIAIHDFVKTGSGIANHSNIKIINNEITKSTGSSSGIHILAGTSGNNLTVNFNKIVGNVFGVNNSGIGTLNATYNYWGSCNGPGFVGPGNGDNVSLNVNFDNWTGVCIGNKTMPECNFEKDNITLRANVTSILNIIKIDSIWFSYTINNVNTNRTPVNVLPNIYEITINSSELIAGKNITWNVYANDSSGFLYSNGNKTFYIRNITNLDITPPVPNGLNGWYVVEPIFNLIGDPTLSNLYYRWDSTGPLLFTIPFGLEDIPNSPPKESAGVLELNYWSNFQCGNETEQSKLLKVDLTTPNITDFYPEHNSVIGKTDFNISAHIDEFYQSNSGINKSDVEIRLDGNNVLFVFYQSGDIDADIDHHVSGILNGTHNVSINFSDNAGHNNIFSWNFTVNLSLFEIDVIEPNQTFYSDKKVPININLSMEVDKLQIQDNDGVFKDLCQDCSKFIGKRSFNDGKHNVTFKAIKNGAEKNATVNFTVDSKDPKIKKILPIKDGNGTFSVEYIEENVKNVTLKISQNNSQYNFSKDDCDSGKNVICEFNVTSGLQQGKLRYWFEVEDIAENKAISKKKQINYDTLPPEFTDIIDPINKTYSKKLLFDFSLNEKADIQYTDDQGKLRSLGKNKDKVKTSRAFNPGNYTIDIIATDKAGNSARKSMSVIILD